MKTYYTPESMLRALRSLYREKCRLSKEAVALKTQQDEVIRRFRAGRLSGDKACVLAYAFRDRLALIVHELLPLVRSRARQLAIEYSELVNKEGGGSPDPPEKMPAGPGGPARAGTTQAIKG